MTFNSPPLFLPHRQAALKRLNAFIPHAGRAYAMNRNSDLGPKDRSNISLLSPYIRHRMITEREVISAVLAQHSITDAEKFIQEVFWRSYFKGYLEARPQIWRVYQQSLEQQILFLQTGAPFEKNYHQAVKGQTGIDCFDAWVRELLETGYLHNHARMWFASIWIFTLRLPWQLGADFTFRHFIDGDPASNTLSWRWVGGLHTKGKIYRARPENIREYTNERFDPKGLAESAIALEETMLHPVQMLPDIRTRAPSSPALCLLTEEDLLSESLMCGGADIRVVIGLSASRDRSPLSTSSLVVSFIDAALADGLRRASQHFGVEAEMLQRLTSEELIRCARRHDVQSILMPFVTVGPLRERINAIEPDLAREGIKLCQIGRPEDQLIWPHASKGFFALKERIPELIRTLGLPG